jgi:hypothetical protein
MSAQAASPLRKFLVVPLVTLLLAALAAPVAAARPAETGATVETYVLPLGQYQLGAALNSGIAAIVDARRSAAEPNPALMAHETVGPAANYARKDTQPSAVPEPQRGVTVAKPVAPSAITYPDPPRSMTGTECRTTLGSSSKFFLKSRFAICSGASYLQTWFKDGKPVGESAFDVVVVGTIPLNSRTLSYTYHVMNMATVGTTGVAGLRVTLKGQIAQSWPSTVAYIYGGTSMPATKTWVQLQAASSLTTTVTAGNGAGSNGSTESIFAVYQPSVSVAPPIGWTLGGATGGNIFMSAPRWDKASYLGNSANGGAATFSYLGTLYYSKAAGAPERAVALHIEKGFKTPGQTQPPSTTKNLPGQNADEPLTRLYGDTVRRDRNRSVAVSNCVRYFGANYAEGGKQCDEYPFATTYQGTAGSEYDPYQLPNNFTVMALDGTENGNAGNLLGQFYTKYRLLDGPDDGYLVKITS